jgi:hypothetical protein
MIWAVIWYWLLAVFTGADVITTTVAISRGAHEVNPFLAPVIEYLVPIKLAFLLGVIGLVAWIERDNPGHGWLVPAGASCVTVTAVVSNLLFFL